jgi:hypothetical protein
VADGGFDEVELDFDVVTGVELDFFVVTAVELDFVEGTEVSFSETPVGAGETDGPGSDTEPEGPGAGMELDVEPPSLWSHIRSESWSVCNTLLMNFSKR